MIPTARDMEGPFYISNTPNVTNLNRFGKKGEVMQIAGRVMNAASPDPPAKQNAFQSKMPDTKRRNLTAQGLHARV